MNAVQCLKQGWNVLLGRSLVSKQMIDRSANLGGMPFPHRARVGRYTCWLSQLLHLRSNLFWVLSLQKVQHKWTGVFRLTNPLCVAFLFWTYFNFVPGYLLHCFTQCCSWWVSMAHRLKYLWSYILDRPCLNFGAAPNRHDSRLFWKGKRCELDIQLQTNLTS